MKRNLYYVYKKVLQKNRRVVSLVDLFKFCDDYLDLVQRWERMPETMTIVGYMPPPNIPKYLIWVKGLM